MNSGAPASTAPFASSSGGMIGVAQTLQRFIRVRGKKLRRIYACVSARSLLRPLPCGAHIRRPQAESRAKRIRRPPSSRAISGCRAVRSPCLRPQIPFLRLVQQVIASAPRKRHDRECRILVGIGHKTRAVARRTDSSRHAPGNIDSERKSRTSPMRTVPTSWMITPPSAIPWG